MLLAHLLLAVTALTAVLAQSPDAAGSQAGLEPVTLGPRVGEALPVFELPEGRTAASLLTLAGETPGAVAAESDTPTFTVRTSSSNASAAPGERFTLVLDFQMKATMHAYAPGVLG